MVKASDCGLQLLIQHTTVSYNDYTIENRLIIVIVQAGHAIRRPSDRIGFTATSAMLNKIVVACTIFTHMLHQLANHIQLVIARENMALFDLNVLGAIGIFALLLFFLETNELLKDVQQFVLLQHFVPQICSYLIPIS